MKVDYMKYMKEFGDTLEAILEEGIHDLEGIVKALNERKVKSLKGIVFTESVFQEDIINLHNLAASPAFNFGEK